MSETNKAPRESVPVWVQVVVLVALLALLAVVAFSLKRTQQGTVQVGDTIPDFTLKFFDGYTYQGKTDVKLSELRGKVVIINFWASWCKPCEQEAAELEAAWKTYADAGQVVFVGADYVDTEPEARGYLTKFAISYPNGPDLGTRISQTFRIKGVPETYFIDQDGKLAFIQIGPFTSEDQIHSIIANLVTK
jgi:cytochrome c biogenesis protein CcmG, thiol:disulfide interchange protein DsbE